MSKTGTIMKRENLEKKVMKTVRHYMHPDDHENVTMESTLSGDLCLDSLDKVEIAMKLEKDLCFREKDAVWENLFYPNDPTVKQLCDFVERRL